ncbi:MAG: gamma-glutamyltransferase family protein [SAR202 cluster bacterium]|jgi:gamma-glutamyltranspeptidase/glutathione hydrolase|nr:gamma-glutamyltransferase family protein [SAR202 cluster bacterium]MDP6663734.1 gamma-glutamyltransferase family protein [SAR202 cluster bacterium]MDP6800469.1 gamma-glutamyltransferase family protein [SAR202 cluster bacterium]|tara:strand:+ start:4223 stop:5974 length:1752 start_codon:yes stop_codon:yes gene_type:complete
MVSRSVWNPSKLEVVAENGAVTAMQPPSAEAGMAMLKAGGNAVDAAVAMAFCNIVLEPYMATIAGMGYMLVHMAAEGKTYAIDFNGRAPRNAHPDMYKVIGPAPAGGIQLFDVEDGANRDGPLSVTVPGTCAGLCEAHGRFGSLPLEQVVEPSVALASDGFEANWHLTLYAANNPEMFGKDPYIASMWLPDGRPPRSHPQPGEKVVQRELGDLLRKIGKRGAAAMYEGEIADEIGRYMRDSGGVLTAQDLHDYEARVSPPLTVPYLGHEVNIVPTPSGAVTNMQVYRILENLGIANMEQNSVEHLHAFIQAARHAYADRFRYLGDWEHADVPLAGMLSGEYGREVAGLIEKSDRADIGVGSDEEPWAYYLERAVHDPWRHQGGKAGVPVPQAAMDGNDEDTTHINVVDKDRNAVSTTHTGFFGSGLNPPGTGVYLTGGMAWFIPMAGYANSLGGWKRPLNNMAPVMVFKEGRPVLCQGAPGARKIMNRGVQVVSNVVAFGMSPQEALVQPTVDASGRETLVDARIPEHVVQGLRDLGHLVKVVEEEPGMTGNFSRPSAITIDYDTGLLHAGVDAFRPAIAMGY